MTLSTFHKVNPIALASWSTAPYACSQAHPCDRPNHNHTGYADPPPPEPPVIIQEPEYPPTYPEPNGHALLDTLQTRRDQGRCLNCGAAHTTWQCPEVAARLFAPEPWKDVALGRELCRMRWQHYRGFVTTIAEVQAHGHLTSYAASYQAYVASIHLDTDLTVAHILAAWQRMIDGATMPRLKVA